VIHRIDGRTIGRFFAEAIAAPLGCRCINVAPTALPFDIKAATVGEGQISVTLSCVEDDGLGEELRVLLAHSMRDGHHQLPRPGG
jgi:hypothetical protein